MACNRGAEGVQLLRTNDKATLTALKPNLAGFYIEFSPDSKALFAAAIDGRVVRWLLDEADWPGFALNKPGPTATALAFSPDNRTIAAGFTDGTIVIWPRFGELTAFLDQAAIE